VRKSTISSVIQSKYAYELSKSIQLVKNKIPAVKEQFNPLSFISAMIYLFQPKL